MLSIAESTRIASQTHALGQDARNSRDLRHWIVGPLRQRVLDRIGLGPLPPLHPPRFADEVAAYNDTVGLIYKNLSTSHPLPEVEQAFTERSFPIDLVRDEAVRLQGINERRRTINHVPMDSPITSQELALEQVIERLDTLIRVASTPHA